MRFDELSKRTGCLLAVVIDNEGKCLALEAKENIEPKSAERMTGAMADVVAALEKLSVEIEILTGKSFLPQEGWALMGQHLSVVMGNGGFRGIVMEEDSEGDGFLFKELLQELQNGDAAGSSPEEGALRDHSA